MPRTYLIFASCWLALASSLAFAQAEAAKNAKPPVPSALTGADRKCFAWFDAIGFPDLAKCKFVKVATGEPRSSDPHILRPRHPRSDLACH